MGNGNNNQSGNRNNIRFAHPVQVYDAFPDSQVMVFRFLKERGVIKPLEGWKPKLDPLPPTWDHGKFCEYHNFSGHDTENCYSLKNHLQDLIEKGVRPVNMAPNVVNNPLPMNQINMLRLDSSSNEEDKSFIVITKKTPPLPVSMSPKVNTILDCYMITWESLLGEKKELNLVADNAEVSHLTRLGKVYQPPVQEEVSNNKESPCPPVVSEDNVPEDPILTQMKKTNANISIWGLICVSKKHMYALSKSFAQAVVTIDTSPLVLTQMIGNNHFTNVIVFSELDIPKAGTEHTDALNIAVDYGTTRIPKVLIDNGSSVNICPSTTLVKLGINPIDLAPCSQTIRASDNTSRNVLGIVSLPLTLGEVSMKIDFYVMDIVATFNLLLGRPWIHEVMGVPSTLH